MNGVISVAFFAFVLADVLVLVGLARIRVRWAAAVGAACDERPRRALGVGGPQRRDRDGARQPGFRDVGTVAALVRRGGGDPLDLPAARGARRRARVRRLRGRVRRRERDLADARGAQIAAVQPRFVDGGIVGAPPTRARDDAVSLGRRAADVAALFARLAARRARRSRRLGA